jgi:hypothetical protein
MEVVPVEQAAVALMAALRGDHARAVASEG